MSCYHVFVTGFGSMGDAVVCGKCGLSKYPEALSLLSRLFSKTIENDGTYMCRSTFPFIIKFDKSIDWNTDRATWTQYMDEDGKMQPRPSMGFHVIEV